MTMMDGMTGGRTAICREKPGAGASQLNPQRKPLGGQSPAFALGPESWESLAPGAAAKIAGE